MDDWLFLKGQFTRANSLHQGKVSSTIRILLCERLSFRPLDFAMSRQPFLSTERAFKLPPEMLPSFSSERDQESRD